MSDHASLAPSSAHRWVLCPGSVQLLHWNGLPQDPGDAAAEGTAAHWVAAMGLTGRALEVKVGVVAENGVVVTQDMLDAAKVFIDAANRTGVLGNSETRVVMESIHKDCWGTTDWYAVDTIKKIVYVHDFKYGFGLVEPYDNWQFLAYASGVYDIIGPEAVDYIFHLTVVQPRVWHRSGSVRTWKISAPELRNRVRKLREAAEEAMGNNPRTLPGPHCKYCPGRHVCPALRTTTLDTVDMVGDTIPVEMTPQGLSAEMRLLVHAKEQLDARLTGLQAHAEVLIQRGTDVPGWTIDHTAGRRDWAKPRAEVEALGQLYGVALTKTDLITPAQAEKAGIPAEVVRSFAARKPGSARLTQVTTKDAQRVFQ